MLFSLHTIPLFASNIKQEKYWQTQLESSLLIGDSIILDTGAPDKVFAIYTEQHTDTSKGAVILLHGMNTHPDWSQVIHPLRVELPAYGWSTLSIQMPIIKDKNILNKDITEKQYQNVMDEAIPRIREGINYLNVKKNIILLGHNLGANMALYYLNKAPTPVIKGVIGISMSVGRRKKSAYYLPTLLKKLTLPIFDIYGAKDRLDVRNTYILRYRAAKLAKNTTYRQDKIFAADHFFSTQTTTLVRRIRGWLDKLYLQQLQ